MKTIICDNLSAHDKYIANKIIELNKNNARSIFVLHRSDKTLIILIKRLDHTFERLEIKGEHVNIAKWKTIGEDVARSHCLLSSIIPSPKEHKILLGIIGVLNFFIFQWFFTRLTIALNEDGEIIRFFFKYAVPLSLWTP